ncbi:MAG: hypothetical protein AAFN92_22075, partial [Bacteroidota bacterium]
MPPPEVASIGKFIDVPVGNFTGASAINIPIHTITEGSIQVPVSVAYHNSGVRVAETASFVGLGWALSYGGIISRTVLGLADETTDGYLNIPDATDLTLPSKSYAVGQGVLDGEPDLFSFTAGGYSGKFIINRDIGKIVLMPHADIRVIPSGNDLDAFTIITPDGTKYHYGGSGFHGYTTVYGATPIEAIAAPDNDQGPEPQTRKPNTGAGLAKSSVGLRQRTQWYLKKIESFDGNFIVDYQYASEIYGLVNPSGQEYSVTYSNTSQGTAVDISIGNNGIIRRYGAAEILQPGVRGPHRVYGTFTKH